MVKRPGPKRAVSVLRTALLYVPMIAASIAGGVGLYVVYDALTDPARALPGAEVLTESEFIFDLDPELGFVHKPDLSRADGVGRFTDRRGARVAGPGLATPATVDLVSIGCSQTFGHGVPASATFTGVLADRLGLSAANLGVSGYSGVSALGLLRRHLDLKPKIVVYGLWEDHLRRNVTRCLETGTPFCVGRPVVRVADSGAPSIDPPHDEVRIAAAALEEQTTAAPDALRRFLADIRSSASRLRARVGARLWPARADQLEAMTFVLHEMARTAGSAGARLIVVYLPFYFTDRIDEPPAALIEFARRDGIELISMASHFAAMKRAGIDVAIPGDGHMTEAAHRAVADEIAARVQAPSAERRSPR